MNVLIDLDSRWLRATVRIGEDRMANDDYMAKIARDKESGEVRSDEKRVLAAAEQRTYDALANKFFEQIRDDFVQPEIRRFNTTIIRDRQQEIFAETEPDRLNARKSWMPNAGGMTIDFVKAARRIECKYWFYGNSSSREITESDSLILVVKVGEAELHATRTNGTPVPLDVIASTILQPFFSKIWRA